MQFPFRFGPYEVVRRLGAGGMAETFVAVRRGPGGFEQTVCLKRILPAFENDDGFVRLFLEEARIAARLRHINVVQVLDFGVQDGSHFMTLELIEGLDLRMLLRAHAPETPASAPARLAPEEVAYLGWELASALQYAHHAPTAAYATDARERGPGADPETTGVVHRDVSPSNVLLSRAGEVKLADFGIAKAMSHAQGATTTSGVVKGKTRYMAPEYARTGRCDGRSDLFSLGVTLYEALSGRRPYGGASALDTFERMAAGHHAPLREGCPDAPAALVDAIERLIRPDPRGRFAQAIDFQDAIVSALPAPTVRRRVGQRVDAAREALRATGRTDPLPPDPETDPITDSDDDPALGPSDDDATVLDPPNQVTRTRHTEGAERARRERHAPEALRPGAVEGTHLHAQPTAPLPTEARLSPGWSRHARRMVPLLAVGGIALAIGAEPIPPPASIPPAPPVATARATPAPAPAPVREQPSVDRHTAAATPAAPTNRTSPDPLRTPAPSPAPPSPATLRVSVLPYGSVWINGRPLGDAPLRLRLAAGTHRISVGRLEPTRARTVRLRPGEDRRVVLKVR